MCNIFMAGLPFLLNDKVVEHMACYHVLCNEHVQVIHMDRNSLGQVIHMDRNDA